MTLSFDAQVGSASSLCGPTLERDLNLPALDESAQDLFRRTGQTGAQQSLRLEPADRMRTSSQRIGTTGIPGWRHTAIAEQETTLLNIITTFVFFFRSYGALMVLLGFFKLKSVTDGHKRGHTGTSLVMIAFGFGVISVAIMSHWASI